MPESKAILSKNLILKYTAQGLDAEIIGTYLEYADSFIADTTTFFGCGTRNGHFVEELRTLPPSSFGIPLRTRPHCRGSVPAEAFVLELMS